MKRMANRKFLQDWYAEFLDNCSHNLGGRVFIIIQYLLMPVVLLLVLLGCALEWVLTGETKFEIGD